MEPLDSRARDALKKAHPGLTDQTIDQVEELLALRFHIDPEVDPLRIQELDRQRAELLAREIPRFDQVLQHLSGPSGVAR